MKKTIERTQAYFIGYGAFLAILEILYDTEESVRLVYIVDDTIIGYITKKRIYYTNKGAYIVWAGVRRYLNEFQEVLLYNKEYTQIARRSK